mgnify:CR=1 FL=1
MKEVIDNQPPFANNPIIKPDGPVNSGKITAIVFFENENDGMYTATSELYNQLGKKIAFGKGTFVKNKILLSEKIGYT